jgi:hypothetical protein
MFESTTFESTNYEARNHEARPTINRLAGSEDMLNETIPNLDETQEHAATQVGTRTDSQLASIDQAGYGDRTRPIGNKQPQGGACNQ